MTPEQANARSEQLFSALLAASRRVGELERRVEELEGRLLAPPSYLSAVKTGDDSVDLAVAFEGPMPEGSR